MLYYNGMKKRIVRRAGFFAIIFALMVLIGFLAMKPFLMSLAKAKIREVFSESSVVIGDCEVSFSRGVTFSRIEIKRGPIYDVTLKRLNIEYAISEILKGKIARVSLEGLEASLDMGNKNIQEFTRYCTFPQGQPFFIIGTVEVSGLKLNLKSANVTLDATLSLGVNAEQPALRYLDITLGQCKSGNIRLEGLRLKVARGQTSGQFYVREAMYEKIKVTTITSNIALTDTRLVLESLSAQILNGTMRAQVVLELDKAMAYRIALEVLDVDLQNLARDLKLTEKFLMTGKLSGRLRLEGEGLAMSIVDGKFLVAQPGGTLIIKDKKVIENIAQSSKLPYEIVVEGFKNYRYNNGQLSLALQGNDIVVSALFEGEAGKRRFDIRWHNFQQEKENNQ
ncbi:MAG: hypothetical protein A2Y00_07600 [Omnitrophica WOR_2 bacterium GWF2_43_52]|nr:MAG: hypothetical protein A2062_03115 [Omnitrophica WOR_2 bacterium GWA2_44_7]OGX16618.1 MAG: hypothetical protein A2Y01_01375 [Omnitrophica WOR_2 bacterium GWC2_44_8]OGX21310.1 MAG: hypothetical protein A2Y00_07600 [Omnitrophica WOR_2 bacterium GWF2_43_52]HAH22073.1 hypothetical protein [Candidatus Omnitrophota bacterium]HBG62750.1 hypothetical protein [Candidatus Omnitrophota bacterium]